MGLIVDKLCDNFIELLNDRRQRKRSMVAMPEIKEQEKIESIKPKKTKLMTTAQYIYQALYMEEQNSDVTVMAMNKVWRLHKVYLGQSPYFYAMFNGCWREATQDFVEIEIIDEHITVATLDAIFGSMYSDEIEIDTSTVVSVLAAATLFHLERILEKCIEHMMATTNAETVVAYYEAASRYGVRNLKQMTFEWLRMNMLSIFAKTPRLLLPISVELMTELTASDDLYFLQTEFSLYTLLRVWMYLRINPDIEKNARKMTGIARAMRKRLTDGGIDEQTAAIEVMQWAYFTKRKEKRAYLCTREGRRYIGVFQQLRTQHLTNHYLDLRIVYNDNIIPKEWFYQHIQRHWENLLHLDHGEKLCPVNYAPAVFLEHCMRYGRQLRERGYQKWRWVGFNNGLDIVIVIDSHCINKRLHHRNEHERMLTLKTDRQFTIRTTITSLNGQHQAVFTQSTGILTISLQINEEFSLMALDARLVHPLLISLNLLLTPPDKLNYKTIMPVMRDYEQSLRAIQDAEASDDQSADGHSLIIELSPLAASYLLQA